MCQQQSDVVKILNPTKLDPVELIDALRLSFEGAVQVYTMGSCYRLYEILKTVFKNAEPWCYKSHSHVLTKIDGYFYDITGEIEVNEQDLFKIDKPGNIADWQFNIYDVHIDCPNCDEIFLRAELEPEFINKTRQRYAKTKEIRD